MDDKRHIYSIDVLRAIAICGVIMQHAATAYIAQCSENHGIANAFRGVTRWNILIFLMITGYLFLSRCIDVKSMWTKYIKRIAIVFFTWSTVYTIFNTVATLWGGQISAIQLIKNGIIDLVSGGTRVMWYLVMLLALYSILPLLSKWIHCSEEKEQVYTCVLMGVLASLLPTLMLIRPFGTVFGLNVGRMRVVFDSIYIFYAMFGYLWIRKCILGLNRKQEVLTILIGGVCLFTNYFLSLNMEDMIDISVATNISICSALVLLSVKVEKLIQDNKIGKAFKHIAECSFGIYLIHTLINLILQDINIARIVLTLPVGCAVTCYSIILFSTSYFCVSIMRKSKLLKKLM